MHDAPLEPIVNRSNAAAASDWAERLERHELIFFPECPFPLPQGDDYHFLLNQQLSRFGHKNISYDPHTERMSGLDYQSPAQARRLRDLLSTFSRNVTEWLAKTLPRYASAWQPDRVSYRPEEEATRHLRLTARNDLLHIDNFPTRPSYGRRILRIFANVNPTEPRIWVTTDSFPQLLEKYGSELGLPTKHGLNWTWRMRESVRRLLRPGSMRTSTYDYFMRQFHDFLKTNDTFQERCSKRYWSFPPFSAWMAFTDAVCHAELRGRFALEHSFFVPVDALVNPQAAPVAYWQRACGQPGIAEAA